MNKTLEEIAQALFKRWFVDFEFPNEQGKPYKSSGGKMVDSEIGEVPEGWEVKTIDDVVKICGGGTPSTTNKEYWEDGKNPFCTPKDLAQLSTSIILDTEQHITDLGVQSISSKQLPPGTLLLSSRAPIGYLAITENPISINQGFIAMICDGPVSNHFMLQWVKENLDVIKGRANGSTFLEISKKNYRTIPFLLPANEFMIKYEEIVEPIYHKISSLSKENKRLVEFRDMLLPKLMNGELLI